MGGMGGTLSMLLRENVRFLGIVSDVGGGGREDAEGCGGGESPVG